MELTPQQEEWLQALESGKYKQGQRRLKVKPFGQEKWEHCCLGVACEIYNEKFPGKLNVVVAGTVVEFDGVIAALPIQVQNYFGFLDILGTPNGVLPPFAGLANLNDKGKSFCEIAKRVREKPEAYFNSVEPSQSPEASSTTNQSQSERQN